MYQFKYADNPAEPEQIHLLNYKAFVQEIPQHAENEEHRLVDQFHNENTYGICLLDRRVVGMLALRSRRPFSLDKKLPELDSYLPVHTSLCEIRLLYLVPEHRNGKSLRGLLQLIGRYGLEGKHDLAVASCTTRQIRFYRHLGFVPFGPLVGSEQAQFQPMYLTFSAAVESSPWALRA